MNGNRDPYSSGQSGNDPQVNPVYGFNNPYEHNESYSNDDFQENVNSPNGGYYEEVSPDQIWNAGDQKLAGRTGPGNILGGIGVITVLVSIIISVLAFIFSWFFYVGFIMNIISSVFALTGTLLGVAGGTMNSRVGIQWGSASIAAVIVGILALMFSGVIFTCTGCAACFFSSR